MTPKEFYDRMIESSLTKRGACTFVDIEWAHKQMDDLLCELLEELGYVDGVKIFHDAEKRYS